MDYKGSLKTGLTPKLGACMVWQKGPTKKSSDGAGHVAIVEDIIDENTVLTSESAYNGSAFFTNTRTKGDDGNW
jgi:surface antigen